MGSTMLNVWMRLQRRPSPGRVWKLDWAVGKYGQLLPFNHSHFFWFQRFISIITFWGCSKVPPHSQTGPWTHGKTSTKAPELFNGEDKQSWGPSCWFNGWKPDANLTKQFIYPTSKLVWKNHSEIMITNWFLYRLRWLVSGMFEACFWWNPTYSNTLT